MKELTLSMLAFIIIAGFFTGNYIILEHHVDLADPQKMTTINTILNYSNSLAMLAAGYFFGASQQTSSKDKSDKPKGEEK